MNNVETFTTEIPQEYSKESIPLFPKSLVIALVAFVCGLALAMSGTKYQYEKRYGAILEAAPALTESVERSRANDIQIRALVERNQRELEIQNASVDQLVQWVQSVRPTKMEITKAQ